MSSSLPNYDGELYERFRPSYPADLARTLFSLTGYSAGDAILEIGCGTGKGTEALLEQGARVHGIEPNLSMGAIAEKKFPTDRFSWSACRFEDYNAGNERFPLVVSAHAFHWVDQAVAFTKTFELLDVGGALAVFRNNRKYDDEFTQREHQAYVELYGGDPHGSWNENYYEALAECVAGFIQHSASRFFRPQVYEFDHTVRYSTEQYLGLLDTYWDGLQNTLHRDAHRAKIAAIFESMGGAVEYRYTAIMYLMFRK